MILESKEISLEIKHVQPFRSPNSSFTSDPDFPSFDIKEVTNYNYHLHFSNDLFYLFNYLLFLMKYRLAFAKEKFFKQKL